VYQPVYKPVLYQPVLYQTEEPISLYKATTSKKWDTQLATQPKHVNQLAAMPPVSKGRIIPYLEQQIC
jgi:hypothetical protein